MPISLVVYSFLSRFDTRQHSLLFLAVASLFFYGWWHPGYLILLGMSLLVNFSFGKILQNESGTKANRLIVVVSGVMLNLLLLGYYKYGGFIVEIYNDINDTNAVWEHVILPLAISFFTFQQITYLIDSYAGKVEHTNFIEYVVFVTFFPQLIAGPIVHHKEMMPQFRNISLKVNRENIEIGITLFAIGLFKKTMLADSIADYVTPIYDEAALGQITFLQAWIASLGFTLQIYFDFSGYSDMALGAARMFGIILPANFNSPLKASSIIDFWSRWHITLTRFLTAYIYNPMALQATRKAIQGRYRLSTKGRLVELTTTLAIPTLITMFLSGLWHGAGYQFLIWGGLHGLFLVINHAWRHYVVSSISDRTHYDQWARPLGLILTLCCVCLAMVFFRANNAAIGYDMALAMLGFNGLSIPEGIMVHLGPLVNWLAIIGITADTTAGSAITYGVLYCGALLTLALMMPNSLDIMRVHQPVLEKINNIDNNKGLFFNNLFMHNLAWSTNRKWALLVGLATAFSIMSMQGLSVFLYWQF